MKCANPDCKNPVAAHGLRGHAVQITETDSVEDAAHNVQHFTTFAAVTCSKACAVALLTPLVEPPIDWDAPSRTRAAN